MNMFDHLAAFEQVERVQQLEQLIDKLQDWLGKLDRVIICETGQTKRHLNSIYVAVGNEMNSLESILEVEQCHEN